LYSENEKDIVMKLKGINEALASSCVVRGFLSGGGLRVVRIEKDGKLKGYGEHPEVDEALKHADEDYLAGGRKYEEVYGDDKIYPHYLTGSLSASSELDAWLLKRRSFRSEFSNSEVIVKLTAIKEFRTPRENIETVLKSGISQEIKTRNGYTYLLRKDGDDSVRISVISRPDGMDSKKDWFYEIQKIGKGENFEEALNQALSAEEVEI
jgi:hypothetical protein